MDLASGHAFVLKGKKNLVSVWKEEEKNRLQKSAARLQILTGQTDPFKRFYLIILQRNETGETRKS